MRVNGVKVLLAPWFKSATGFTLRIYDGEKCQLAGDYNYLAEISSFKGQRIALALLQEYAESLRLSTFNVERSLRMAVEATLPDDVAERLIFALKKLGEIHASRIIPNDLAESPSLTSLERFLSVRKVLS